MTRQTGMTGWFMTDAGKPLQRRDVELPQPQANELLVRVAGCGVCHTDISFLHLGIKTRADLPLVLGHEISGTVEAVGDDANPGWVGKPVLIPAVLPCGVCELCKSGHRTICRAQIMPGNDRHGGFATHVVVPADFVCPVGRDVLANHELWELAIVSDAVTTPFMAVKRAGLQSGDFAVVIGVGGIGVHCVQIAAAVGAKVVALDVDARKLQAAEGAGACGTVDVSKLSTKEVRQRLGEHAKRSGATPYLWKIFETSGTRAGQETAFNLLGHGSHLSVVGFTMDKLELRLSNLMAFDATVRGNWGCDPVLYPEVLSWLAEGRIHVKPFVERHPLSEINEVLESAHRGALAKRAVLVP